MIDLRTALLNERVDGLEAVRRLQRPAQHAIHAEAMQRQGLVQAFRQTAGRRLVPILQLMLERLEGGESLVVFRTVVRGGPRNLDRLLRWDPDQGEGVWNATEETELSG